MGQVWQRVWAQGGAGAALGFLEGWSSSSWPQGTKVLTLKEELSRAGPVLELPEATSQAYVPGTPCCLPWQ